jgi:hypothetical protein
MSDLIISKMKQKLFLIILFGITVAVVVLFWYKTLGQKDQEFEITKRPTATPYPKISIYPSINNYIISPKISDNISEKMILSGIEMNNFYISPIKVNRENDAVIFSNDSFHILYLYKYQKFQISILATPFSQIRLEAENKLLDILGIDKTMVCRLNVEISTPYWVNPDYSDAIYKPTFCGE